MAPAKLPAFHPSTLIRDWGNGEGFSIADALTGVCVLGATGSGKTSGSGAHLALGYLAAGFGGIVLCAKQTERAQFEQWAEAAGRWNRRDQTGDLVIFDASAHRHRFNFLDWEASQASAGGGLTINVVALLEEIITALQPGKSGGGEDGEFWTDALHQLLMNTVELVQLAGRELSLSAMRDIVRSAPLSRQEAKDKDWQKESACWFFLNDAERNTAAANAEVKADYAECRAYFLEDFAQLSEKTRSVITLMFTKLAQPFTSRPLRKLFSEDTTIRPEDTFLGKIIIVDLSTQSYRLAGTIAALVWKYCWQVAVMRRPPAPEGQYLRPVHVWADEAASNFLSPLDSTFQAVARSGAGCTVYLAQNISQFRKRLGDNDAFESFISNLQTLFVHQSTGPTCRWMAERLGEQWVNVTGISSGSNLPHGEGDGSSHAGVNVSEQRRFLVEPSLFTTLKRGGPAYGFQTEAICYKGGHIFRDGLPFKLLTFDQRK
jgi:type IV secretory pathway TraG/TraD family ATPase VirD4